MTMSRNSNASETEDSNTMDISASGKSTLRLNEVLKDMLNEVSQGDNFILSNGAVALITELAEYFVTEACHRASVCAVEEGCDRITVDHIEKCVPQLMLDFS